MTEVSSEFAPSPLEAESVEYPW